MIGAVIPDAARRARWRSRGRPAPAAPPIHAVAADGWRAAMAEPADLAFAPVSLSRQGFDPAGPATTHAETLHTTKRVRLSYPNQATLTADQVALSDYVYSTDTIPGVTNSSVEASPKPVANWSMPDRRVVGDSVTVSLVAFHRNGRAGKPVACVEFRATDGTKAIAPVVVSSLTATADPLTGNTILEYVATLDISALADNADIAINAKVYPWIGGAGSVLDSADLASQWQFSPRIFRKNTSRAAAPPLVYVASGGNDTTGYVGTNAASAAASPCATLTGAINRARAVLGTSTGALDGLRMRLAAGSWTRAATPTGNTVNAAIVIEPAPGVAKGDAVFQFGAASNTFGLDHVIHSGLTISRQGANGIHNRAGGTCVIENCDFDFNGSTGAIGGSAGTLFHFINTTFTGQANGAALGASTNQVFWLRGCILGSANSTASLEMRNLLGCTVLGNRATNKADISGSIVAFNRFLSGGSASGFAAFDPTSNIDGLAFVQNLVEWTSTSPQPALRIASDNGMANAAHVIVWHNTFAGFNDLGRGNILYDESSGTTRRAHRLQSLVGNIHVQINTKSDIWAGAQGLADAPNRTGNWAYMHGVGCRGEFSIYRDAGSGLFAQEYSGMGARIGTVNTGAGQNPLYTDNKATTSGPTAGAGGGTYTLEDGSPADDLVLDSPLGADLAGAARTRPAAAGAYA